MSSRKSRARRAAAPSRPGTRRPAIWMVAAGVAGVAAVMYASMGSRPTESAAGQAPVAAVVQQATPVHGYEIVREYPHDPDAFTQGLVYRDGFLYESTGLHGRSTLRQVELETGRVVRQLPIDERYFAEGLADYGNRLIQLTWQTNVAFVYDLDTFERQTTLPYPGEGWGLARDEGRLILSDGTPVLRFLEPETFRELGRVPVRDGARPVDDLNELEMVKGELYANVWHADRIAIIDPASGRVTAWLDLTGLRPAAARDAEAVLNGIAYDAAGDRLFVTGKLWPALFEIRVRPGTPR